MKKRAKQPLSYKDAHNRAVRMYRRCSFFLLWAGVVAVFAALIGVIQMATQSTISGVSYPWPSSGFALTLTVQILLSGLILKNLSAVLAGFLIMLIALVFGSLLAFGGFFASRGHIAILISSAVFYALDFAAMFFVYQYLVPMVWTNYAFTLVIHVVVLAAIALAIVEFYNVLHIEKVFNTNSEPKMDDEVESEVIASGKE